MHLLQQDLNDCANEWNKHRIRYTRGASSPSGIPDELYFLPSVQGKHIPIY